MYMQFSNSFLHFLNTHGKSPNQVAIGDFQEYGKTKSNQLRQVCDLVAKYLLYDLGSVFATLKTTVATKELIIEHKIFLEEVHRMDQNSFGKAECKGIIDIDEYDKLETYTQDSIVNCHEEYIKQNGKKLKELYKELIALPKDILRMMEFCLEYKIINSDHDNNQSFCEAIGDYSEKHWIIWECQNRFDKYAMRFLLWHPKLLNIPSTVSTSFMGTVEYELGLLCASKSKNDHYINYLLSLSHNDV